MEKQSAEKVSEEHKEQLKECLQIATDNRKFEIDLLWRRTVVFWGFVAVLFLAVKEFMQSQSQLALILSVMGAVSSLIWSLVNRGSKAWQESWELKANRYVKGLYGYKLYDKEPGNRKEIIFTLRPRDYSLSRLLIALSDYIFLFWLGLSVYLSLIGDFRFRWMMDNAVWLFCLFSLAYGIYILCCCRSRPRLE